MFLNIALAVEVGRILRLQTAAEGPQEGHETLGLRDIFKNSHPAAADRQPIGCLSGTLFQVQLAQWNDSHKIPRTGQMQMVQPPDSTMLQQPPYAHPRLSRVNQRPKDARLALPYHVVSWTATLSLSS
ncbi:hypothetical protein CTRI78_v007152 [Colletotrichum trifolii]|uniref:Uncharacterized protein n=1 Tax=Colletotrichum trifolii TaxID=5466 RepID=A0A4R8RK87_COLTR|nr:hypothetical protein CTRI78_v007152 [Colletotrichum trifolii]